MPKRSAKPAPRCAEQPAVAAILKILSRPRGATVAEIEGSRPAPAHGALGRQPLGSKAGLELSRTKVARRGGLLYRAAAKGNAATPRGNTP